MVAVVAVEMMTTRAANPLIYLGRKGGEKG
jgi:hypothetical protein